MKQLIAICLSFIASAVVAQQTPITNFWVQNQYAVNPAYAGHESCIQGFGDYRRQWTGLAGGPSSYGVNGSAQIKDVMGVGAGFMSDKLGNQSMLKFSGTYAYGFDVNAASKMRFGVSAMVIQHSLSTGGAIVTDYTDALLGASAAGLSYGADFGMLFVSDKITIGAVVPQLFYTKTPGGGGGYKWNQHLRLYATKDVYWGSNWMLYPGVMIQTVPISATQVDLTLNAVHKDKIMMGVSYRSQAGFSAMIGLYNYKDFTLGYAYEIPLFGVHQYSIGSHQVALGYKKCIVKGEKEERINRVILGGEQSE